VYISSIPVAASIKIINSLAAVSKVAGEVIFELGPRWDLTLQRPGGSRRGPLVLALGGPLCGSLCWRASVQASRGPHGGELLFLFGSAVARVPSLVASCAAPHAALCARCDVPDAAQSARFAAPNAAPYQISLHLWAVSCGGRSGRLGLSLRHRQMRARPPAQVRARPKITVSRQRAVLPAPLA
jgi:hypothetical protein